MVLSKHTPLSLCVGDKVRRPVCLSDILYEGGMLSWRSTGYVGPLVAGEKFAGHAAEGVDNSTGANGDRDIDVYEGEYLAEVTLTSVAITDERKPVYASDDATLTLTPGSNSFGGFVEKYVRANTAIVRFVTASFGARPHQHTSLAAEGDGGPLTSPRIVTSILDANGVALIALTATASAKNWLTLANAATGASVGISVDGSAAAVGLKIGTKSVGDLELQVNALDVLKISGVSAGTNYMTLTNAATGAAVTMAVAGSAATCDLLIDTKGAGKLGLGSTDSTMAFFNGTGAVQQNHIADAAGSAGSAITTVNAVLAALEGYGLLKES